MPPNSILHNTKHAEHIDSEFVRTKTKHELSMCFMVSAHFKVYISQHHADCSVTLRVKHLKPSFPAEEDLVWCSWVWDKRDNTCNTPDESSFQFWVVYFKIYFPHILKACMWHYFHFYAMSEDCKNLSGSAEKWNFNFLKQVPGKS